MSETKILVVENSHITSILIRQAIEKRGWHVVGMVGSGKESIEFVKERIPDLILMDVVLDADMDGIDAAININSHFDIPIVFLISHRDRENIERVKKIGSYEYITKPFKTNDLYHNIESTLHKHESGNKIKK